eukprot:6067904-Amphidinium_carterae.1
MPTSIAIAPGRGGRLRDVLLYRSLLLHSLSFCPFAFLVEDSRPLVQITGRPNRAIRGSEDN